MGQVLCFSCRHPEHPLRRCLELLGSDGGAMPEPVYCECTPGGAMENEIERLTSENQKLHTALLILAEKIAYVASGRKEGVAEPIWIASRDWELIAATRSSEEPVEALLIALGLNDD
jgi:hypothetical protein